MDADTPGVIAENPKARPFLDQLAILEAQYINAPHCFSNSELIATEQARLPQEIANVTRDLRAEVCGPHRFRVWVNKDCFELQATAYRLEPCGALTFIGTDGQAVFRFGHLAWEQVHEVIQGQPLAVVSPFRA
jgi:hypothetical protein